MFTTAVMISPMQSAQFIAASAKHVFIDYAALKEVSFKLREAFETKTFSIRDWKKHTLHPKEGNEDALDFIFVMDSLNFSFWTEEEVEFRDGKYSVQFEGVSYTGYFALVAAMNRAIHVDKIDITDANIYSNITKEALEKVFRSDTKTHIPMIQERLDILHENGRVLLEKFKGRFSNVVKEANGSAQRLLQLILSHFPSFRDECQYKGRQVSFYKRAQILVSDVWSCFEGSGLGNFSDIDSLSMFADYRVPQILNFFGVIKYSEDFLTQLKSKKMFNFGDEEEVEIRGVSIQAVDLIKKEVEQQLKDKNSGDATTDVNSILIDYYLWDMRRERCQEINDAGIPFHRTRSIYY